MGSNDLNEKYKAIENEILRAAAHPESVIEIALGCSQYHSVLPCNLQVTLSKQHYSVNINTKRQEV
jgi:hypothetical protein